MPRFFVPDDLVVGSDWGLPEKVVRHIQVLRLRVQDEIVLFNGNGKGYPAQITRLEKRAAEVRILREEMSDNESPLDITLIQAVSSGERMDFTVQKCTELGVRRIIPVSSSRSIVKLGAERADKKIQRWQDIAISACEQCGRNIVPEILPIMDFQAALSYADADLKLLMGLKQSTRLTALQKPSKVAFLVGPEGGWTEAEEALAFQAAYQAVSLGNRVLRTETAGLAAIAAMQTLWGDMG